MHHPSRTPGLWFLPVSFAAGVATTTLLHSWLWPRSPVVLEREETKRIAATVPPDETPPLSFYEMRVPWERPRASKRGRSDNTAKRVPSPRRIKLAELASSTRSGVADTRAPAILGEDPPAVNPAKSSTPFLWNLDLPNRGPSPPVSSNDATNESITQIYEGTILDAACVSPSCSISSATTMFALRLDDGKMLPFDTVGNLRAQAKKKKSRWVSKTLAGKEIRAKVSGMVVGNELIAVSID